MASLNVARRLLFSIVLWTLCTRVCATEIKIGMTGPLYLDQGMRIASGLRFAFEEVNAAGGVMAQNISLVVLNDDYNVTKALQNIETLVDEEQVVALAGVIGSDVVVPATNLILERHVPYVGAYSGISELRSPFHEEFVNVRVSFSDEMVAQAIYLVQDRMVQRVACLYQNDSFGVGGYAALVKALANVGIQPVASGTYVKGTTDVEAAVEAIAGAAQKAQVVVFVALQDAIIRFLNLFAADPRVDPGCFYTAISAGWGTAFASALDRRFWGSLYFFFVVPLPNDTSFAIAKHFNTAFGATGESPGPIAFEGYIIGRLVVEVLRNTHSTNITRSLFLDQVYHDRLYVLDDLVVGMYSGAWAGCDVALCSCNTGLREVHLAQLDPAIGDLGLTQASLRYSVLACSDPVSSVIAPLLFGQLLPAWDAGWHAVAAEVGRGIARAFAEANAAGGAGGRRFVLLQQNSSANATCAMDALSYRYPLLALLGSVVLNTADFTGDLPILGDLDINPESQDEPFTRTHLTLKPTTALELMGLAQFAVTKGCAIHLRAPNTGNGPAMLDVMIKSVHSFQKRPASATLYAAGADIFSGAPSGCVIALGSDADVPGWFAALPAYPDVELLTLATPSLRLMELLPNANSLPQAARWHFPTAVTGNWNTTVSGTASDAFVYGYIAGSAAVQAMRHSEYAAASYTTPAELVKAWYSVSVMTAGSLTFGPYYSAACTAGNLECECNTGARTVGVRSVASPAVESLYSIVTCNVVYTPLQDDGSGVVVAAVVGSVVGGVGCALVALLVLLYRLGTRNNAAAPRDPAVPFCVLFTDIQASTHLWATIPDIMAPALDTHHELIRKLLAKHKCYEVKTIGDSFMCAAHTPQQGLQLALAIQRAFHEHDWGSGAINAVYRDGVPEDDVGRASPTCWNGLRVRVGMHYGLGEIKLDPVSKGYDYYGTVVNTAARIESVCHGGQIGVSQAVYDAVGGSWPGSVWKDLGHNELRGLAEPIHLYQVLPVGPYSKRTFPPLRLQCEDRKQEALEAPQDLAIVTQDGADLKSPTQTSTTQTSVFDDWRWLEAHPLVVRGDVPLEDMKRTYSVALAILSTLLSTQTVKFKEVVLQGLCERLHVTNFGPEGAPLQRTLKGLVHRILPAAALAARHDLLGRHFSGASGCVPSDSAHFGSGHAMRDSRYNKVAPVLEDAEEV